MGHLISRVGLIMGMAISFSTWCFAQSVEPKAIQVSAGSWNSCAVSTSGLVTCWGGNPYETRETALYLMNAKDVVRVFVGWKRVCALSRNGEILCASQWGEYEFPKGDWIDVKTSALSECALSRAGELFCRQPRERVSGVYPVPGDLGPVNQFDLDDKGFACATTVQGRVRCWGEDKSGFKPVQPPEDGETYTQVALADRHVTCAITSAGDVKCWGKPSLAKVQMPLDFGRVVQVAVNEENACARSASGGVFCWGDKSEVDYSAPADLGPVIDLSMAYGNICAVLASGGVRCWGKSPYAAGHSPTQTGSNRLMFVDHDHVCTMNAVGRISCFGGPRGAWQGFGEASRDFVRLSGWVVHSPAQGAVICGIDVEGKVICSPGKDPVFHLLPPDLEPVNSIYFLTGEACALLKSGRVRCWNSRMQQVSVPEMGTVTQLVAGHTFYCALNSVGRTTCWGDPRYKLDTDRLPAFRQISMNNSKVCGLSEDGKIFCQQMQHSGSNILNEPKFITQNPDFVQISSGVPAVCALDREGRVSCWNEDAEPAIAKIWWLGRVSQLASGGDSNLHCAIDVEGAMACWGEYIDYGARIYLPARMR